MKGRIIMKAAEWTAPVKKVETSSEEYTALLEGVHGGFFRKIDQIPFRRHIRRLNLGRVIDVGCGTGRHLLNNGGVGVGIDHNAATVAVARRQGLTAYVPEDFYASDYAVPESFDSLLCGHVVEHLSVEDGTALLREYLPYVKPGGRVVILTPQELGFRGDPSHVRYVDFEQLDDLAARLDLTVDRSYSFPLPQVLGKFFWANEFVLIARKAGHGATR